MCSLVLFSVCTFIASKHKLFTGGRTMPKYFKCVELRKEEN